MAGQDGEYQVNLFRGKRLSGLGAIPDDIAEAMWTAMTKEARHEVLRRATLISMGGGAARSIFQGGLRERAEQPWKDFGRAGQYFIAQALTEINRQSRGLGSIPPVADLGSSPYGRSMQMSAYEYDEGAVDPFNLQPAQASFKDAIRHLRSGKQSDAIESLKWAMQSLLHNEMLATTEQQQEEINRLKRMIARTAQSIRPPGSEPALGAIPDDIAEAMWTALLERRVRLLERASEAAKSLAASALDEANQASNRREIAIAAMTGKDAGEALNAVTDALERLQRETRLPAFQAGRTSILLTEGANLIVAASDALGKKFHLLSEGFMGGFGADPLDLSPNLPPPQLPPPVTARIKLLRTQIDDAEITASWGSEIAEAKEKLIAAWKATKAVTLDPLSEEERIQAQEMLDKSFPFALGTILMAAGYIERYGPGQGRPDIYQMIRDSFPPSEESPTGF